jgi:hypothetical protein
VNYIPDDNTEINCDTGRLPVRQTPSVSIGSGDNPDRTNHTCVFVLEDVAMINERPDDLRIPEIHPKSDAWIFRTFAVPERQIDGIPQDRFIQAHRALRLALSCA